jgi:hypothetical protein
MTSLLYTAEHAYEAIVKLLLAKGVEADMNDHWGSHHC